MSQSIQYNYNNKTYKCQVNNTSNLGRQKRIRRNVRKSNHKKFIRLLTFYILCSLTGIFIAAAVSAVRCTDIREYTVTSGDTLWHIAENCNTQKRDIRDVMDDIMKINSMKDVSLKTGDVIKLPVY